MGGPAGNHGLVEPLDISPELPTLILEALDRSCLRASHRAEGLLHALRPKAALFSLLLSRLDEPGRIIPGFRRRLLRGQHADRARACPMLLVAQSAHHLGEGVAMARSKESLP
eukprot:15430562-Alexandrium_andersonii.AAC.1